MNPDWKQFLLAQGAAVDGGRVAAFGDPSRELAAARNGTVVCDLSHYGLIRVAGAEAREFLHSQLSSDVRSLADGQAQFSSYNTAKGRMLASLLMWPDGGDAFLLQLAAELAEPIRKRLAMFILRSKAKAEDVSDALVRIGVAGPDAGRAAAELFPMLPGAPLGVARSGIGTLLRLEPERFELILAPAEAPAAWTRCLGHATPAGHAAWDWLDIRAGWPRVTPATQEQFVPQMANLELIGGVSFKKGCYPGQEIVARTHYLGKVKRRMFLAHIAAPTAPAPGDELYSPDAGRQASGMIVNVAPSPDGGFDALAVVQVASAEAGDVRWKAPDGPRLTFRPLPYQVPT
ncbi:MAG: YgfZ/GcvT domain-containing protein [Pseudomonadota bacterium]